MNYKEMYLVWVNEYVTLATFAEHYEVSEKLATRIIDLGRVLHEESCNG